LITYLHPTPTPNSFYHRQVAFSWIAAKKPHLLLLDEPTNHLDLETIDSLARAINEFDGGCVLVSHDFRLIQQVWARPLL
jgi:ATP-binding cassette subfamily F protein 2